MPLRIARSLAPLIRALGAIDPGASPLLATDQIQFVADLHRSMGVLLIPSTGVAVTGVVAAGDRATINLGGAEGGYFDIYASAEIQTAIAAPRFGELLIRSGTVVYFRLGYSINPSSAGTVFPKISVHLPKSDDGITAWVAAVTGSALLAGETMRADVSAVQYLQ